MSDERFEAAVAWLMGAFFLIVLFFIILYLGGVFEAAPYRDHGQIIIHSTDGPLTQQAVRDALREAGK